MASNLLTIASNTFTEAIRQPIFAIVIAAAILTIAFCPSLAMFTLENDNQILKDIGLSTLMVAGLFLAVFAASTVISEEIERKTTLTVLTKRISRHTFILGKFVGIVAAIVLSMVLLALVLLIIVRYGVMQTSSDEPDMVVITLGVGAALLTLLISLAGNYFYHWRFSSTAIFLGSILALIITFAMFFIDPDWKINPANNHINLDVINPIILTIFTSIILSAIATAVATRLSLIMTLITCGVFFLLGIMVPYWLWPVAQNQTGTLHYLAWAGIALVPHINFYVVSNAIYANASIPVSYITYSALYAFLYVTAVLLFAIAMFRSREIG
jgi:ABC-2 type transport system permease protein